jgi:hypothetical protein
VTDLPEQRIAGHPDLFIDQRSGCIGKQDDVGFTGNPDRSFTIDRDDLNRRV